MIFEKMCDSVNKIMAEIHTLPFNQELAQGILPREIFLFYLEQDALYLTDFSKALALTAARLSEVPHIQQWIEFALGAISTERALHLKYLTEEILPAEQSPFCFMYTNYLLKMASLAPIEEAVASLLPCFWIYQEVGSQISLAAKKKASTFHPYPHPYQSWIEVYSSEQFALSVSAVIDTVNQLGVLASETIKDKMIKAFMRSTQLEYYFWKGAYLQEKWQIMI